MGKKPIRRPVLPARIIESAHIAKRRVYLAMDFHLHQIHEGVVDYARQAGWILDARASLHHELVENIAADGILTYIGSNDHHGPTLRATGLPIVNMSPWRPELGLPTVLLDNRAAGALAAEHLIGRGFQHLTMVVFHPYSPTSVARCEGFAEAARAAGRQFHPLDFPHLGEQQVIARQLEWVRKAFARLPHPLGVFAEGDSWAVELMHLCFEDGLAVPDQVAIVGIDNNPMVVDVAPVPLTSVDNNLRGLGYAAAELLDQILSGAPAPKEPVLIPPIGVVQRQSTNALAVDDQDILLAVRYIENQFARPLTIDQVAEQTHLSSRRLQDRFKGLLGRTIGDEIQRCRLERATGLLRETDMKLETIAERSGFGNAVQMTKVFTRELKTSPARYRKSQRKF